MKNKWTYIFLVIVIATIALFFTKQNLVQTNTEDKFTSSLEKAEVNLLKGNIILNNKINGKAIEVEVEDIYGKEIQLNDLRAKSPKLVYFYSELTCDVCVDQSFEYFNNFIDKAGVENAIVLVESKDPSYITTLIRLNHIRTKNIFRVTKKNIDAENRGFFFVLDQSPIMHHTFFPMKEIPEVTDAYFKNLDQTFGLPSSKKV